MGGDRMPQRYTGRMASEALSEARACEAPAAGRQPVGTRSGRALRAAFLWLGALACASTPAETTGGMKTLQDVRVERDGESTVVTLVGLEDALYTAYLQQDPQRVTVDLASVEPAEQREPVAVYDGLVEQVAVAPLSGGTGAGSTRVEVSLAVEADYAVEQVG